MGTTENVLDFSLTLVQTAIMNPMGYASGTITFCTSTHLDRTGDVAYGKETEGVALRKETGDVAYGKKRQRAWFKEKRKGYGLRKGDRECGLTQRE